MMFRDAVGVFFWETNETYKLVLWAKYSYFTLKQVVNTVTIVLKEFVS
jgi:hypothetical protein